MAGGLSCQGPLAAAVATPGLAANKPVLAAPVGDQPLEVEHLPAVARRAIARQLVLVLMQRAERVERDHPPISGETQQKVMLRRGMGSGIATFLSHISRRWPRSGSMVTAKQPRPRPFKRPPWQRIAPWRWRRYGSMKGS